MVEMRALVRARALGEITKAWDHYLTPIIAVLSAKVDWDQVPGSCHTILRGCCVAKL